MRRSEGKTLDDPCELVVSDGRNGSTRAHRVAVTAAPPRPRRRRLGARPRVLLGGLWRGESRPRHLPGEEGVWVFILGDMTIFAVLFATYLYYRGASPEAFGAAQEHLDIGHGVLNTVLLLASSLCVVFAVRGMRLDRPRRAPLLLWGAIACGLGFVLLKYVDYNHLIDAGLRPDGSNFWTYFFVLTGLHLFHLLLGMGVLVFLLIQAKKPALTPRRLPFVEGGGCFWHMVDMLWIVIFPLLYLMH